MEYWRTHSGLLLPGRAPVRRGICSMLMVTSLIGFAAGGEAPSIITGYSITASSSSGEGSRCPSAWSFQYSDDGSAWTTIESQSSITFTDGQKRTYTPGAPAAKHRYWRWNCTAGDASHVTIGELELLASGVDQMPTMSSSTSGAITVSASAEAGGASWKAFDDANGGSNRWAANAGPTQWIRIDYGSAI